MNHLLEIVAEVESAGAALKLEGDKVKILYTEDGQRERLTDQIEFLRAHRDDVVTWLKSRAKAPAMPHGVRLVFWELKEPPVAIEACAVVVDPELFARTTLEQLAIALDKPKRWVGWSVPPMIDRLRQVGVGAPRESRGQIAEKK